MNIKYFESPKKITYKEFLKNKDIRYVTTIEYGDFDNFVDVVIEDIEPLIKGVEVINGKTYIKVSVKNTYLPASRVNKVNPFLDLDTIKDDCFIGYNEGTEYYWLIEDLLALKIEVTGVIEK